MRTLGMHGLAGVATILTIVGCGAGCGSGDDGGTESGNQDLSFSTKPFVWDQDIPIPDQSIPLSHTFSETLTKSGVTVTPAITPSGKFGLTKADVHVQVTYTANPPKIDKLDVFARGDWTASARLDLDVKAGADFKQSADFRKSFTAGTSLGGKAFELFKVPLAVIPLPQAPNIQFQLDLELAASCEVDFDAELHAFAEIGVGGTASADVFYNPTLKEHVGFVGNGGINSADQFHITIPPHVSFKQGNLAQLTGKCGLQPSLNATAALGIDPTHPLADVGIKLIVEPYAGFEGKFTSIDDWSVDAKTGVRASISPFGDFFGRSFAQTQDLEIFDFEIGRGPSSPNSAPAALPAPDAPAADSAAPPQ